MDTEDELSLDMDDLDMPGMDDDTGEEEEEENTFLDDNFVYTGDLEADLKGELLAAAAYASEELEAEKADSSVWIFENTPQKVSFLKSLAIPLNLAVDVHSLFIDGHVLADGLGIKVDENGLTRARFAKVLEGGEQEVDELAMDGMEDMEPLDAMTDEELSFVDEIEMELGEPKKEKVISADMETMLKQYGSDYWADYHDGSFMFIAFFDIPEDKQKFYDLLGIAEDEYGFINGYAFAKQRNIPVVESSYRDKDMHISESVRSMAYHLGSQTVLGGSLADAKAKLFRKDKT